jgi:hypothetical protein
VTIATTSGSELTIAQHISLAYRTIGILEASQLPSEADYTLGKQHLQNLVNGLERWGIFARAVELYTLELTEELADYSLPSRITDMVGTAMYRPEDGDGDAETPVTQMTREQYQMLGLRGSTGLPTRYWVDLNARSLHLWLAPDEAGSVRFQARVRVADVKDIAATLDLEQYWDEWINQALGAKLALSKGREALVPVLSQEADLLLTLNRNHAEEGMADQPPLCHPGGM